VSSSGDFSLDFSNSSLDDFSTSTKFSSYFLDVGSSFLEGSFSLNKLGFDGSFLGWGSFLKSFLKGSNLLGSLELFL